MGGVEPSSYCMFWDKLISLCPRLWIIKGEEVLLQFIRCFLNFGWFASVVFVPLAAKEVVYIASKLIEPCIGTFPTYLVRCLCTWHTCWVIFSANPTWFLTSMSSHPFWSKIQLHMYCQAVQPCVWVIGSSCIFHVVQTLILKLGNIQLR